MRTALGGLLLAAGIAFAAPAQAQDFPTKPIRMIVPYAAGGGTDLVARMVAQKLNEKWGQPVIVENRAGAGGNLGAEAVFTAAPDGYTLLFTAQGPLVVNKSLYGKLNYDPDAFTPISLVVVAYSTLLANPNVPAENLPALMAYAKANPGRLNYASQGIATAAHLTAELFNSMAGVKIRQAQGAGGEQRQAARRVAGGPDRGGIPAGVCGHVMVGTGGAARNAAGDRRQDFGRRRRSAEVALHGR
jgi:tripartite-type tricarboxylate transporter receptor subunit TctC